jgi:hypothetical protein
VFYGIYVDYEANVLKLVYIDSRGGSVQREVVWKKVIATFRCQLGA